MAKQRKRGIDYDTLRYRILKNISPKRRADMKARFAAEDVRRLMLDEYRALEPTPHFNVGIPDAKIESRYSATRKEEGLLVTDVEREERWNHSNPEIYVLKPEGLCCYWGILIDGNLKNHLPNSDKWEFCDLTKYLTQYPEVFEALEKAKE